jgi:hypothetical protein
MTIVNKIHRTVVADGSKERKLLTNMIVSTKFLEGLIPFYDPNLIQPNYARVVAEWCMHYFNKFHEAPSVHIKDIFELHSDRMETAERTLIADLLSSLSDEYEKSESTNIKYLLSMAGEYFKHSYLSALSKQVGACLTDGDVEGAENLFTSYKLVGGPDLVGRNLYKLDGGSVIEMFEREETPLFTLPGKLGWKLNSEFNRDRFFAFLGPEKRGKTWWLNEIAIRAAKARCNVALFQIGDMSEDQIMVRLSIRLAGRSNKARYCTEHETPIPDCLWNQLGKCPLGKKTSGLGNEIDKNKLKDMFLSGRYRNHTTCQECIRSDHFKGSLWYKIMQEVKPLTGRDAFKAWRAFQSRTRGRSFYLSVHPSDTLTVTGLKSVLNRWEASEGFIPDVVVIDYADNLAPEDRGAEFRHQQHRTWQLLRGLSQERHCLVVTATQASASSYDQQTLAMKHFSEDKRKYAEVTAMVGLNQNQDEKVSGLMRINMIVQREGEFYSKETVKVAQDLRMGRPLLFSF